MEVIRKVKKEVKKVQVGDQIVLGRYTATAVAQDASGTTFCFDQVYGETPTKTPFDARRMKALYKSKAMDSVRNLITPLFKLEEETEGNVNPSEVPLVFFRSPTAEEVFSKQRLRSIVKAETQGTDKRWEAMKNGSYRVGAGVDGESHAYWTESTVNPESPVYKTQGSNIFVHVSGVMGAVDPDKQNYIFWRPVFKLNV